MQKGTAEVEMDAAAMGAATAVQTPEGEPVVPVRSAKDAINAMYASDAQNRLSNYLATSAKEIINANGKAASKTKSAANLHRGSINHQMEAVRPSASGIFKTTKVQEVVIPSDTSAAMDPLARKTATVTPKRVVRTRSTVPPVVKTSLKLAPKKSPSKMSPQNLQKNRVPRDTTMRAAKGPTALAEMLAARRKANSKVTIHPEAAESIQVLQQAARKTTGQPEPIPVKAKRTSRGKMMDVMRPARSHMTGAGNGTSVKPTNYPIDSVKRRFATAPKDYTRQPETLDGSYTGYDFDAEPPQRPPVEIYGMMEEEPKTIKRNPDGLGVVEDYHPQGSLAEQKVAQGSGKAAPDNNKYALGGQSPFFLKSVNVEKRPLSDAPSKAKRGASGTLYEKPGSEPLGRKNVYNAPVETKKALPTKPTVIIPASRRSKAPLVFLLILTVALGAAVGAFVYLCFFQYME